MWQLWNRNILFQKAFNMPAKRKFKPCGKCANCLVTDTCGKCTHCTQPHLKRRCKAKTCKVRSEVVVEEETQKVGVREFNPNGNFARVLSASLAERRPDMTADQVEVEVKHRWGLWMENQQPTKPSKSQELAEKEVRLDDFGFARLLGGFLVLHFLPTLMCQACGCLRPRSILRAILVR